MDKEKTFYLIKNGSVFYFDDYYFQKPQLIPSADAASFKVISQWFGSDQAHVYFLHNVVIGVDPRSFTYLGGYNCQWAKDRSFAYYFWPTKAARQWKTLESKSLEAFKILPSCRFSEYAGDEQNIFYMGRKIRGVNAKSFHIMPAENIEDKSVVKSFSYGRDHKRIYFNGKPIEGINCESFRVVHASSGTAHREYGTDGVQAFFNDSFRNRLGTISYSQLPASIQEYLQQK